MDFEQIRRALTPRSSRVTPLALRRLEPKFEPGDDRWEEALKDDPLRPDEIIIRETLRGEIGPPHPRDFYLGWHGSPIEAVAMLVALEPLDELVPDADVLPLQRVCEVLSIAARLPYWADDRFGSAAWPNCVPIIRKVHASLVDIRDSLETYQPPSRIEIRRGSETYFVDEQDVETAEDRAHYALLNAAESHIIPRGTPADFGANHQAPSGAVYNALRALQCAYVTGPILLPPLGSRERHFRLQVPRRWLAWWRARIRERLPFVWPEFSECMPYATRYADPHMNPEVRTAFYGT